MTSSDTLSDTRDAEDDPAQHVAPQLVGAEQVGLRPAGEGRRLQPFGQRRVERIVWRELRGENGRHDHEQQHRRRNAEVELQEDVPAAASRAASATRRRARDGQSRCPSRS